MNIEKSKDGTIKLNFPIAKLPTTNPPQNTTTTNPPQNFPLSKTSSPEYSAVIIPLGDKKTLCLSSQIGCAMGCSFCISGKRKFERNLSLDELKEQLEAAREYLNASDEAFLSDEISSIVFMGMGEPLLNLENVLAFCDWINKEYGYAYSRLLISTSGIIPKMREVIKRYPNKVQLALSLHSPFQEIRDKIMPGLKAYPIKELIEVCHEYNKIYRQKIMIEYVMIDGLTDRDEDLEALIKMNFTKRTNFNLIPLNSNFELDGKIMKSSSKERMSEFRDKLMSKGYKCFTRTSMGGDIEAACGMLR